jgi:Guanosine polyphosphate pyrophosphohydrolases/synthetases
MSTLTKAIIIAAKAHDGQTDKGGNPYILHPIRLMLNALNEQEKIVALLHDVVEDSEITLDDLRNEGFSEEIIEAVDRLTRRPTETYDEFIERIEDNDIARRVKILDLLDNSMMSRIKNPSEKDLERLKKYRKALEILREREYERN